VYVPHKHKEEIEMKKLKFFDGTKRLDPFLNEVITDIPNTTRILVNFNAAPVEGTDIFEVLQKVESVKDFNASTNNEVHLGIELEGRYTEHAGVVGDKLETATLLGIFEDENGEHSDRKAVIFGLPSAPENFGSFTKFNEWIEKCPFTIDVWLVARDSE
jgi:hypothetical protein